MRMPTLRSSLRYSYGGMAYANPDAVTQIANGLSTTTFVYDNSGNVTVREQLLHGAAYERDPARASVHIPAGQKAR